MNHPAHFDPARRLLIVGFDAPDVVRVAVRKRLYQIAALVPDLEPARLRHSLVVQVNLFGEEGAQEAGGTGAAPGCLQKQDQLLVQDVLVRLAEALDVVGDISGVVLDDESRSSRTDLAEVGMPPEAALLVRIV